MAQNVTVEHARRALRPKGIYRFAAALADGQSPEQAAKLAGANLDPMELLDHPEFTGAILAALHRRITSLAPQALQTVESLLKSENEKIKLATATLVINKALPDVRKGEPGDSEKDLESMSTDKLAALVDKLENELADRAKDVTPDAKTADNATIDATRQAKTFDFME